MKNKIFSIILLLILSEGRVFAVANSVPSTIDTSMHKIVVAMIGILLFSIFTFICLSIYNKFLVPNHIKNVSLGLDSLNSPTDYDDAIRKFIIKNKLR